MDKISIHGVKNVFAYRFLKNNVIIHRTAKINNKTNFEGNNIIHSYVCLENTSIGFASYIGENSQLENAAIGKFCSIAAKVICLLGTHPSSKYISTHPCFFSINKQAGFTFVTKNKYSEFKKIQGKSIVIGNDVWIGYGAILMQGINIGNGAIIGAGAVVTRDIPPYAVCVGSPAKVIKYRFLNSDIEIIEKSKWWEKSLKWLEAHAESFESMQKFKDSINYK